MRDCRLKQVMSGRIEPIQARLGTQPRQLAFGELPGRRDAAFDCLLQAIFAIQITPELPVSDRANRRQLRMQITARMQGTYPVAKTDRKSTRLNSSHSCHSRMPSTA